MYRHAIVAAAVALGLGFAAPASAGDCREMRAAGDLENVWEGVLAYNDGSSNKNKSGCFATRDECFQWMARSSGDMKGQARAAYCRNLGTRETVQARDFLREFHARNRQGS